MAAFVGSCRTFASNEDRISRVHMPKIENLAFPSAPRANIVKDFAIFELTDHDPFMSSRNAKLFARRFCQRQLEELRRPVHSQSGDPSQQPRGILAHRLSASEVDNSCP